MYPDGEPTNVDFLGIGAQKAATSWLHVQLAGHPQIWFPAVKETHFWDRRDDRDVSEWLDMFASAPSGVIRGEITPAYGPLDESVIREIARAAPQLRIFYSIRNPIERAWSAALMDLSESGQNPLEVGDDWYLEHFESAESRARGDYLGTIRRWRRVFGEKAVHLLWFDEIKRDPRSVLIRLASDLGVDDAFYRMQTVESIERRVFVGSGIPVRSSLQQALLEIYAKSINDLATYLDLNLKHWNHVARAGGGDES